MVGREWCRGEGVVEGGGSGGERVVTLVPRRRSCVLGPRRHSRVLGPCRHLRVLGPCHRLRVLGPCRRSRVLALIAVHVCWASSRVVDTSPCRGWCWAPIAVCGGVLVGRCGR